MPERPRSPSASDSWLSADSVDSESDAAPSLGTDTDDVLIGTTLLDSYQVEQVLGEGGMGRIYQARHTRIAEKRFAVKVLRPELITSAQVRGRFQREIEAVARITHPSVLSIVDVGTTERGWPFMVCEYLNGLDLLRYLRRFGPLTDERAVQLGSRIAEALEATHAQGVIHRDLKPSNVFLLGAFEPLGPEWDRVKLIDFGLSRFVSRDDQLSKTGVVMGTPAYMSPEQARGSRTDHLTDVYGVGAVLYAAATGLAPFREENQQQTLIAVMSREPERPRALNPAISEALEVIIQRAMAKEPEQRFPSMSALRLALSNLEARSHARRAGKAPRLPLAGPIGVRWRFAALASSAALLGAAALVSVLAGFLASSGGGLQLSTGERAVLSVGLGALVGAALLLLWRFQRSTWRDTAKLSDWLPKLRFPVLTAIVVYGLASFGLRFAEGVLANVPQGAVLQLASRPAWPGWSALLASLALLAGVVAALHQSWWRPMRPSLRWAWGSAVAATVALGALAFVHQGSLQRGARGKDQASGAGPEGPAFVQAPALAPQPSPAPPAAADAGPGTDAGLALSDGGLLALHDTAAPVLHDPRQVPLTAPSPAPSSAAFAAGSASSASPGAASARPERLLVTALSSPAGPQREALPAPALKAPAGAPKSADDWKARAVEYARTPADLPAAVEALEKMLQLAPERAGDPDVRRIMVAAATSSGEASPAAFRLMSNAMGSKGPDLLYDLMLEHPELADRAKFRLTRYSVRRHFSPQLSIAFDLRFAATCAGRTSMLQRAHELGDERSINVLSSLVSPAPSCGKGGSRCAVACPREAALFARSIERIAQRLRASQREASVD